MTFSKMTIPKAIALTFLIAFLTLASFVCWAYFDFQQEKDTFVNRAFVQLDGGEGDEYTEFLKLPSGESYSVILEHACCSGRGFDAVAIKFSDGTKYFSNKNYCGVEGFHGDVVSNNFTTLAELSVYLKREGYELY